MINYTIFIIFLSFPFTYTLHLSLPLIEKDGYSFIEICVGTPKQCMSSLIYFSSCKSYIADSSCILNISNKYSYVKSTNASLIEANLSNAEYPLINQTIGGIIIQDILTLNNNPLGPFNFYLSSQLDNFPTVDALLGLCHSSKQNLSYSIIDNISNHSVISIKDKEIIFGILPPQVLRDYKKYGRCSLNKAKEGENEEKWSCELKNFAIGGNYKENLIKGPVNPIISFEYGSIKSFIPKDMMTFLERVFFKKLIEENNCMLIDRNNYTTIACKENNCSNNSIFFFFDDWVLQISKDKMLILNDKEEGDYKYELVFYSGDNITEVVLGKNVLMNFISVFDKKNEEFGFYSKSDVIYIGKEEIKPPIEYEKQEINITNFPFPLGPVIHPNRNKKLSWSKKFLVIFGILIAIAVVAFIILLLFRYLRRRKFKEQSFYYKVNDDIFESGVIID